MNTSQKIATINEIDEDSRELWAMLNDNADNYEEADIKQLFINILSKDSGNNPRFDVAECTDHINKAIEIKKAERKADIQKHSDFDELEEALEDSDANNTANTAKETLSRFDVLHACFYATRKTHLHRFLFDAKKNT